MHFFTKLCIKTFFFPSIGQKMSGPTLPVYSVAQQLCQDLETVEQGRGIFGFSCCPALGWASSCLSPSPTHSHLSLIFIGAVCSPPFYGSRESFMSAGTSPTGSDSVRPLACYSHTGDQGSHSGTLIPVSPSPFPKQGRDFAQTESTPLGRQSKGSPWVGATTTQSWSWGVFLVSNCFFTLSAFSCTWLLLSLWTLRHCSFPLVLSSSLFLFLQTGAPPAADEGAHSQAPLAPDDVRGKGKKWFDSGCYHVITCLYKPALSSALSSPLSWGARADACFRLKMW